jgi:histidyl-tRNA synthetase
MASAKTQPARGMRDFLPEDVRRREYVIGVIKAVYERYGFEPLETPAVENIETLMGKYGEEGNQLIFKILKRGVHEATGEADLALRYDLTVPLARVVAQHQNELGRIFKRYQIQPVWRADRPGRGRFREFYQCDVDVIGSTSMMVEAELCAATSEVLKKLKFADFTIKLNHRGVLTGVLDAAGIPNDHHGSALIALDKLDKIGRDGVTKEFDDRGIATSAGVSLLDLFEELSSLDSDATLNRLKEFLAGGEQSHEAFDRAVEDLQQVLAYSQAYGTTEQIKITPNLARGLSYYTGPIMEISVPDLAGSLGGGGRYDNLIGMFLGKNLQTPACGFSLGLERILVVMNERQMFPPAVAKASAADVLITFEKGGGEELVNYGLKLAKELREHDIRTDTYSGPKGQGSDYAQKRNIPFRILIRQRQLEGGEVRITDLRLNLDANDTREHVHYLKHDEVVGWIGSALKG